MPNKQTLEQLAVGGSAKIRSVEIKGDMKTRMEDLGLIGDTLVKCVGRSPFGDPKAYFIRGTVIAIRNCDAKLINITVEGENDNV